MKIHVNQILDGFFVKVGGNESWLQGIYKFFPTENAIIPPKLQANLSFEKLTDTIIKVNCEISYSPLVNCSRCNLKITWPISENFDTFFRHSENPANQEETKDLAAEDLDDYYLKDGLIDIQNLISEHVHLAIPSQTVSTRIDNPDECLVCDKDISDKKVFGVDPEDDPTNPFAALKRAKVPPQ